MSDYKLSDEKSVIRVSDQASVPNDPQNRDWAEYQAWLKAGGVPDDPDPPPEVPLTVMSHDLVALFTIDDAAKIQAAVATNPKFWLLWSAMTAQKDPMDPGNARFQQGWAAMVQVLGADRMTEIAKALGVTIAA